MIGVLMLLAMATAGDLPPAPAFEWSAEQGCRAVIGIDPGDAMPDLSACSYVLVPADVHADLLKWRIHAEAVRDLYAIETLELEITLRDGFEWRDARISALEKPAPVMQRPGTQRAIGILEATGAILLGVVVVTHATEI